jgi:hypothetical protein
MKGRTLLNGYQLSIICFAVEGCILLRKLLRFSYMPAISTEAYIKIGVLFDWCESKKKSYHRNRPWRPIRL